ncbi:hypothetical protein ACWD6K_26730 [Streptomyces sp. NPDC002431]
MNSMDEMIRQYVYPVARSAKFSRRGRRFQRVSDRGDSAILEISVQHVDPNRFVFDVICWIVPATRWSWLRRNETQVKIPDSSGAIASFLVIPPDEFAHAPNGEMPFRSRWAFDDGGIESCGQVLRRMIEVESIPCMVRLLDRVILLSELRNPESEILRLCGLNVCEILLRVDDGSVEEVEGLLAAGEEGGTFPKFLTWARERLAERVLPS